MFGSEPHANRRFSAWVYFETNDASTSRWDLWQPGMAYVDFTNPDACKWYVKQLEGLMDIGVDTFKVRGRSEWCHEYSVLMALIDRPTLVRGSRTREV
jgi:collagenase-like PrtC family protease